jgi:uncharacterized protein YyaL (SSP411 family)
MIFHDDATPAGNGSAALALNRLARLLGEMRYADAAERCLRRALPRAEESPLGHTAVLLALRDAESPPAQLLIAGKDPGAIREWKARAAAAGITNSYPIGDPGDENANLPGILGACATDRPASAWLCLGMRCLPPAHDDQAFERLLENEGD